MRHLAPWSRPCPHRAGRGVCRYSRCAAAPTTIHCRDTSARSFQYRCRNFPDSRSSDAGAGIHENHYCCVDDCHRWNDFGWFRTRGELYNGGAPRTTQCGKATRNPDTKRWRHEHASSTRSSSCRHRMGIRGSGAHWHGGYGRSRARADSAVAVVLRRYQQLFFRQDVECVGGQVTRIGLKTY